MPQDITGTETFTNGVYRRPSDGDKGDDIFDVLETFMERIANHSHSGADSRPITLNIQKDIDDFVSGTTIFWSDQGNDVWRAQIAVPSGTTYDASIRKFYLKRGGEFVEFYPTTEKIDAQNMYVFANEALAELRVVTL